jgi:hypothetical protein
LQHRQRLTALDWQVTPALRGGMTCVHRRSHDQVVNP